MSQQPRVGTVDQVAGVVRVGVGDVAAVGDDGAYSLGLFGDVATEMCIVLDGDEGLFASYSDVQFKAPVRAGDVLEITATLVREGTRSRVMDFAVHVVGRGAPTADAPGAAEVLDPPVVATTATGTVVVPPAAG